MAQEKKRTVMGLVDAFPLLLLIVIIFGLFTLVVGDEVVESSLAAPLFGIPIISGDRLAFEVGDLFVLIALALLFAEVLKSTSTGASTILNHGLSAGVMTLCIVFLLVVRGFGNTTFLYITLMTMFDVVAGFTITAISAKRDIGMH